MDFSGLKAGDRIAIYYSEYSKQWYAINRVVQRKGDSLSLHMELREITPAEEQAIRAQISRRKIGEINASELTDEQAIALYGAYQQIVGGSGDV